MKPGKLIFCCAAILSSSLLLTSCVSASVGRSFPAAGVSQLVVGTTTKAQVIQIFGPPYEHIDAHNWPVLHFGDDETSVILRYVYGQAYLFEAADQSLQLEFNDAGQLVDYHYLSNFSEDKTASHAKETNFDILAARTQIIPGKTIAAEVVSLVGTNYTVLPFNKPGVASRWYFAYSGKSTTPGQGVSITHSKWLIVDFDAQGTVQHIRGASDFLQDLGR